MQDKKSDSFAGKSFPLNFQNVTLFLFLWVATGFVLGTSFLYGPVRWSLILSPSHGPDPGVESRVVALAIAVAILFSFRLTFQFVRTIVRTSRPDIRFGIPGLVLLFVVIVWIGDGASDRLFSKTVRTKTVPTVAVSREGETGWMRSFLEQGMPNVRTTIALAPMLSLFTAFIAIQVGRMRVKKNIRVPYTRKVFHFFIFTLAAGLQPAFGLSSVVLFGIVVGLAVLYAVLRGKGFPFYDAIARQTDAPHSTFFVTVPFLSTAVGGIVANLISIRFAPIGYLITGWGDAVAEPVGSQWGRHWYKVPGLDGIHVDRSLEGSLSILLVGTAVVYFWCLLTGMPSGLAAMTALLCASIGTVVEGISNHGLDNFTIQVAVTAAAVWVAG